VQRQRIENFKNGRCFNSAVAEQKTPQETAAFFFSPSVRKARLPYRVRAGERSRREGCRINMLMERPGFAGSPDE
jgi:hypothetical protein